MRDIVPVAQQPLQLSGHRFGEDADRDGVGKGDLKFLAFMVVDGGVSNV